MLTQRIGSPTIRSYSWQKTKAKGWWRQHHCQKDGVMHEVSIAARVRFFHEAMRNNNRRLTEAIRNKCSDVCQPTGRWESWQIAGELPPGSFIGAKG